jgi:hypothetical protein
MSEWIYGTHGYTKTLTLAPWAPCEYQRQLNRPYGLTFFSWPAGESLDAWVEWCSAIRIQSFTTFYQLEPVTNLRLMSKTTILNKLYYDTYVDQHGTLQWDRICQDYDGIMNGDMLFIWNTEAIILSLKVQIPEPKLPVRIQTPVKRRGFMRYLTM